MHILSKKTSHLICTWLTGENNKLQQGYVHTKPDKFENATFAAKTDKMFSVHINRFQRNVYIQTSNPKWQQAQ